MNDVTRGTWTGSMTEKVIVEGRKMSSMNRRGRRDMKPEGINMHTNTHLVLNEEMNAAVEKPRMMRRRKRTYLIQMSKRRLKKKTLRWSCTGPYTSRSHRWCR